MSVLIVPEATAAPEEALLTGKVDLVITYRPLKDARFAARKLFSDELVAVVPPDHRLASRKFVRAADFASEVLLSYGGVSRTTLFQSVLAPAGVSPRRVIEVPLTEAMLEMVRAGLGISVLSRWAVAPHVDSGVLRALRIAPRGLRRQWSAVRLKNAPNPNFLDEFLRLLAEGASVPAARSSKRRSA